jgi:transcription initiation factor TFIIB
LEKFTSMSEAATERKTNTVDQRDGHTDRTCQECGATDLQRTADETELVCSNCGLVVEGPNAHAGAKQRRGDVSEQESRVGPPLTQRLHDKGLATTIDWRDKDAYGTTLSPEKRRQMDRLRDRHQRCRVNGSGERNLRFACGEIDRIASVVELPESVRETASATYRRALSAGLVGGYATETVAATGLYIACRIDDIPRTMAEIATASRVTKRDIGRAYRRLSRELDINLEPVDPRRYLPRLCSALDCSEQVRTTAADIIETTVERGSLAGKAPMGCAAGAVYLASLCCDEKEIQRDIAAAAGISVATLRSRYHDHCEATGIDEQPDV